MRTPGTEIKLFNQAHETVNGFFVAKLYDLNIDSLMKLLKPYEVELREKGVFLPENPSFNREQFLFVLEKLGSPANLEINFMSKND